MRSQVLSVDSATDGKEQNLKKKTKQVINKQKRYNKNMNDKLVDSNNGLGEQVVACILFIHLISSSPPYLLPTVSSFFSSIYLSIFKFDLIVIGR